MGLKLLISTEFAIKLGTHWLWLRPRRAECLVASLSWLGKEKVFSRQMTIQHSFSVWITKPLTTTSEKLSFIVIQHLDQHLEIKIFLFLTIVTKITIHILNTSVNLISHLMLSKQMSQRCIWLAKRNSQWLNTKCTRSAFD